MTQNRDPREKLNDVLKNLHGSLKWYWQVVMGLAIVKAVDMLYTSTVPKICDESVIAGLCFFLVFLPTFARFYFGDSRALDKHYIEYQKWQSINEKSIILSRVLRIIMGLDVLLLMLIGICFVFMAPSLANPNGIKGRTGIMDKFMKEAIKEARIGLKEGGIPIGSVLVVDGHIVGRGHNRRVQNGSAILHAEMDCLENVGRLTPNEYRRATLYTTLSPCDMCSGAVLLYKIPKVVIGENNTFQGPEDYLHFRKVKLEIRKNPECIHLMSEFIKANPDLWNEDIGEIGKSG